MSISSVGASLTSSLAQASPPAVKATSKSVASRHIQKVKPHHPHKGGIKPAVSAAAGNEARAATPGTQVNRLV